MEKTQEQNESRLDEIIENFLEQLKCEYKNFSVVISVNDSEGTICCVCGTARDIMNNIVSIENNEVYQKVKKLKERGDRIKIY